MKKQLCRSAVFIVGAASSRDKIKGIAKADV